MVAQQQRQQGPEQRRRQQQALFDAARSALAEREIRIGLAADPPAGRERERAVARSNGCSDSRLPDGRGSQGTSPRQIEANRRNARHSTGPRTDEGKARSSGNARSHGLFARDVLLPGEDAVELAKLTAEMHLVHNPAPGLERAVVDRIVRTEWLLRRAAAHERRLALRSGQCAVGGGQEGRSGQSAVGGGQGEESEQEADDRAERLDRELLRLAAHEARLTSQLLALSRELRKLQSDRWKYDDRTAGAAWETLRELQAAALAGAAGPAVVAGGQPRDAVAAAESPACENEPIWSGQTAVGGGQEREGDAPATPPAPCRAVG